MEQIFHANVRKTEATPREIRVSQESLVKAPKGDEKEGSSKSFPMGPKKKMKPTVLSGAEEGRLSWLFKR